MTIHIRQLLLSLFIIIAVFFYAHSASADIFTGLETEDTKTVLGESETNEEFMPEYIIEDPKDAVELKRLFLDAATITKGYTVMSDQEDFKAGVVDNAVTVPVTVVLKKIPAWHIPVEKTETKVSYMFDVDIRACHGGVVDCDFSETKSLGVLEKPIYIAMKFNSENYGKKVIHFWNKPTQTWVPLKSTTDFDNNLARTELYLPYARLAVFEDEDVQEGLASWYYFKDCHCAASHVYKRGTQLKVTNISGSPRHGNSLIVTVNDYGPDPHIHPDRPIDLDAHAYSHLAASLKSGLMMVRVEPLNPELAEKYEWIEDKKLAEKN